MGALTNETKAFTYRVWENDLMVEVDDTEIKKYRIRLEKAKTKRVRYLPIHYWISNQKRFKAEEALLLVNIFKIILKKLLIINRKIKESKLLHLLLNVEEIYIILLKKVIHKEEMIYFTARDVKKDITNIPVYNDLLLSSYKKTINEKKLVNKEGINTNIIFLTNTRLESPDFNAYLHINADTLKFTSVSFFVSSFAKDEIPFSYFNLINAFTYCCYPNKDTTIITSLFTSSFRSTINVLYLAPLFINPALYYPKYLKHSLFSLFSYKYCTLFSKPFISNNIILFSNIIIPFHFTSFFDNFILKKLSHKFFYRLSFFLNCSKIAVQSTKYIRTTKPI